MISSSQVTLRDASSNSRPRSLLHANYNDPRFSAGIHRLRAIAILFIVTIHCSYFFDWTLHPVMHDFISDVFDNSTVLFVFISGFLFQHLGRSFKFRKYLGGKLRNVGAPYLIAALPAIIYSLIHGDAINSFPELQGHSSAYVLGWLFVNGGAHANYALWFMPVVFIFYAAAPLFRLFQKYPYLYLLLALLMPISILEHRPTYTHGHNFALALYFLPIYISGMLFSQYRHRIEDFIDKRIFFVVGAYVAILLTHFLLSSHHGKYTGNSMFSFEGGFVDWLLIQQMFMAFALYALVKKLDGLNVRWLDLLAETSFTVYFVHLYVLWMFKYAAHYPVISGTVFNVLLLSVLTVVFSCFVALTSRIVFGRFSRSILGS